MWTTGSLWMQQQHWRLDSLDYVPHPAHSDIFFLDLWGPPPARLLTFLPVNSWSHVRKWQWLIRGCDIIYYSHCLFCEAWALNPRRAAPLPSCCFFLLPECNKSSSTMPRREMSGVYFWYLWPYKIMPSEQKHPLSCSQRDQEYFLIISLEQFIFEDTV